MGEKLTVGLVGCGQATRKYHIPALKALDGFKLQWVCDTDEERAKETGTQEGTEWYTDPNEAMAMKPDLININTPPFTHKDLVIDALEVGTNVLLEKPTAMTVDEVDELIQAENNSSQKVCVVHNNLYFDPMLSVLRAVERGEFGEILSVRSFLGGSPSEETRNWSQQSHGGPIGDRLPHPIYLVTYFMNKVSDRSVDIQLNDGVVDGVSVQIDDGKRFGYVEARQSAIPAKSVEVIGSKKRANIDLFNYNKVSYDTLERSPVTMLTDNVSSAYQIMQNTGVNGFNFIRDIGGSGSKFSAPGHYHLLREYRKAILNDNQPPIGLRDGRKVVEILNEIESEMEK